MSKARKITGQRQSTNDTVPHGTPIQLDSPTLTRRGVKTLLEQVIQEILTVTYWFDPELYPEPYSVTIRFSGHRINAKGRLQRRDRFTQDEIVERVVPGSGPISLTARVHGINAGEWMVTAQMLESPSSLHKAQKQKNESRPGSTSGFIPWLWCQWVPVAESDKPVSTCPILLARVPGLLPGIWAVMVVLGMLVALLFQFLVIAHDHLAVGPWWMVTLGAIVVGVVTAKGWYIIRRHDMLKEKQTAHRE